MEEIRKNKMVSDCEEPAEAPPKRGSERALNATARSLIVTKLGDRTKKTAEPPPEQNESDTTSSGPHRETGLEEQGPILTTREDTARLVVEGPIDRSENGSNPSIIIDDVYADEPDHPEITVAIARSFQPITNERERHQRPQCVVVLATDHEGTEVARKTASSTSDNDRLRIKRELVATRKLKDAKHFPDIVRDGVTPHGHRFFDRNADQTQRVLSDSYLINIPISTRLKMAEQLLIAIYESHQTGVLPRDWAPENIAWDESSQLLTCFDLSAGIVLEDTQFSEELVLEEVELSTDMRSVSVNGGIHAQTKFQTHREINDPGPWTELKDRDRAGVVAAYILGMQVYGAAGWSFLDQTCKTLTTELDEKMMIPAERNAILSRFKRVVEILKNMSHPTEERFASSQEMLQQLQTDESITLLTGESHTRIRETIASIPTLVKDVRRTSRYDFDAVQTSAQKLQDLLESEDKDVHYAVASALFEWKNGEYRFHYDGYKLDQGGYGMFERRGSLLKALNTLYSTARSRMLTGTCTQEWQMMWGRYFKNLTRDGYCHLTEGQERAGIALIMRMIEAGITLTDGSFFATLAKYARLVPDDFLAEHVLSKPDALCAFLETAPFEKDQYRSLRGQMKFRDGCGKRAREGWDEGLQREVTIIIPEETPAVERYSFTSGFSVDAVLRLLSRRFNPDFPRKDTNFLGDRGRTHLRKVQDRYRTPASLSKSEYSYGTQEFVMIQEFLGKESRHNAALISQLKKRIIENEDTSSHAQTERIECLLRIEDSCCKFVVELCHQELFGLAITIIDHHPDPIVKATSIEIMLNQLDRAGDGWLKRQRIDSGAYKLDRAYYYNREAWNRGWLCRTFGEVHLFGSLKPYFEILTDELIRQITRTDSNGETILDMEQVKIFSQSLSSLMELFSRERRPRGSHPFLDKLKGLYAQLDKNEAI
jgi:hypothetical protein